MVAYYFTLNIYLISSTVKSSRIETAYSFLISFLFDIIVIDISVYKVLK